MHSALDDPASICSPALLFPSSSVYPLAFTKLCAQMPFSFLFFVWIGQAVCVFIRQGVSSTHLHFMHGKCVGFQCHGLLFYPV